MARRACISATACQSLQRKKFNIRNYDIKSDCYRRKKFTDEPTRQSECHCLSRGRRVGPALGAPASFHAALNAECEPAPSQPSNDHHLGQGSMEEGSKAYSERGQSPRLRAGPPHAERRPTSAPKSPTFRTESRLRPSRARCCPCARVKKQGHHEGARGPGG